ncbi:hypothetical protein E2C01_066107 [Portunus trituberculatus]|uniref:Nucleic-acid-binding protein from mobile element jockey n=1 Tax=Portunus trituberculatus TaxID=210409 RepID=A0A5B7HRE8_PORTR|nr:hypothetical protein [Portunus trituberculatus]
MAHSSPAAPTPPPSQIGTSLSWLGGLRARGGLSPCSALSRRRRLPMLVRSPVRASLPLADSGFKTELLHSRNISDSDTDYIPNLFGHYSENSVPEVRQIPFPRWFVGYYRNGCGNFIHASRYLSREIGTIPEGRGCSIGCLYSQDLYDFPDEETLAMCPTTVQKVTMMRNSSNMVLLSSFGSTLPDRVHIGPINLRVRRFVSRPLQCFSCYGYGHDKSSCKKAARCGNCSALDSHSEEHCNAAAYCFHCRDGHQRPPRTTVPPEGRYWCDILCFIGRSLFSRFSWSGDNSCYLLLCWGGWFCSFG